MEEKTAFDLFNDLKDKPKNWDKVVALATKKSYPKGFELCKAGNYPKNYYFIKSGIVRKYYTNKKGKEFNKLLFTDNHITASLTALSTNSISNFTIECLTPVTLYEVPFDKLMAVVKNDLELANLYTEMIHLFFRVLEESELEKVTMEATERYLNFQKRFPSIINKAPLFHIASYLGITPIQLSRIRKKLKENN